MSPDSFITKRYSEETIERALQRLAVEGSSRKVGEELGIPHQTLRYWRRESHRDRYDAIRAQVLPAIRERIARDTEDLTIRYAEVEHEMLDQLDVSQLRAPDLAQALPRIATARGISNDKANTMRDRPATIVEHRSATEIIDSIARRNPALIVDSTAEEID